MKASVKSCGINNGNTDNASRISNIVCVTSILGVKAKVWVKYLGIINIYSHFQRIGFQTKQARGRILAQEVVRSSLGLCCRVSASVLAVDST